MMINHTLCFISFPEIQIAFYSYLYKDDSMELHRPCGSCLLQSDFFSTPQLNWGVLLPVRRTKNASPEVAQGTHGKHYRSHCKLAPTMPMGSDR